MAGQTVKGQLLTRVRKRPGFVALVRVHRIRNVAVRKTKELEAIFRSCVGESERECRVWLSFIGACLCKLV